ncbi:prepilin peptidase [Erwinia sp.]|uniref:prepilin peptidase n=1 Tax=Erwinia citreus TaxID=558 RepID=UPI003C7352BF
MNRIFDVFMLTGTLWCWLSIGLTGCCIGRLVWFLSEWLPAKIESRPFRISRAETVGYWLLPILCCFVSLLVAATLPARLLPASLLFSWVLLALIVIDLRYLLLPDILTLCLLWFGLLGNVAGLLPALPLQEAVLGAVAGYGVLALLSHGYRIVCHREGLGLGDAKLFAALGAWLGMFWLPWLLLIASLTSLISLGMLQLTSGRPLRDPFPFGAALAFTGWILFICSNHIT